MIDLKDFKYDGQHVIEVDEGNTAVIACDLPESHPKAQVRYSVKQEWLEASRGEPWLMVEREAAELIMLILSYFSPDNLQISGFQFSKF